MDEQKARDLGLTDELLELPEDDPRVIAVLGDERWPNQQPVVDGVLPQSMIPQEPDAIDLDPTDQEA